MTQTKNRRQLTYNLEDTGQVTLEAAVTTQDRFDAGFQIRRPVSDDPGWNDSRVVTIQNTVIDITEGGTEPVDAIIQIVHEKGRGHEPVVFLLDVSVVGALNGFLVVGNSDGSQTGISLFDIYGISF